MNQHRDVPRSPAGRAAKAAAAATALPADHVALVRAGTWLRDGTVIRVPLRARLALVRPQMLKARAGGPAGS
jgi:hypothetical protein